MSLFEVHPRCGAHLQHAIWFSNHLSFGCRCWSVPIEPISIIFFGSSPRCDSNLWTMNATLFYLFLNASQNQMNHWCLMVLHDALSFPFEIILGRVCYWRWLSFRWAHPFWERYHETWSLNAWPSFATAPIDYDSSSSPCLIGKMVRSFLPQGSWKFVVVHNCNAVLVIFSIF